MIKHGCLRVLNIPATDLHKILDMVPMNIKVKVILLNRYFSYVTNNLRLINDKFMFRGRTDPHILSKDSVQSLSLSLSLGLDQVSMRLARFF